VISTPHPPRVVLANSALRHNGHRSDPFLILVKSRTLARAAGNRALRGRRA
jgi:hypothetical protein